MATWVRGLLGGAIGLSSAALALAAIGLSDRGPVPSGVTAFVLIVGVLVGGAAGLGSGPPRQER